MELQIPCYQAIELLEKYYTEFKWPIKNFQISNMQSVSNGGDGSYSVVWDLIDLRAKKLIKASDHYDSENGGYSPDGEEWSEEFSALEERVNTYGGELPTVISVDTLLDAILEGKLNERGHNRSLGRRSDGSKPFEGEVIDGIEGDDGDEFEACTEDV